MDSSSIDQAREKHLRSKRSSFFSNLTDPSWRNALKDVISIDNPRWDRLSAYLGKEKLQKRLILPPEHQRFAAFNECPFDKLRVVIIGHDPYVGVGQAHGMSYSVNIGRKVPPSLSNIFRELEDDSDVSFQRPNHGCLKRWASQEGVLLLNSILTVQAGTIRSHKEYGWEAFTDAVVDIIDRLKHNVVFMAWGKHAKEKCATVDSSKHCILLAGHPSRKSVDAEFFGCRHFSKCNAFLERHSLPRVDWHLDHEDILPTHRPVPLYSEGHKISSTRPLSSPGSMFEDLNEGTTHKHGITTHRTQRAAMKRSGASPPTAATTSPWENSCTRAKPALSKECFNCGKMGHYTNECPQPLRSKAKLSHAPNAWDATLHSSSFTPPPSSSTPSPSSPLCGGDDSPPLCTGHNLPCIQRITQKSGRNHGRPFWTCAQPHENACRYFQWADGADGSHAAAQHSDGGGACFKCGGKGHWAKDCSSMAKSSLSQPSGGECFKCGEPGHWSKDCPRANLTSSAQSTCFKCGKPGHWRSQCPY